MKRRTKLLVIGGIAAAGLAISALVPLLHRHPVGNAAVPQPAKSVELPRYLGRWYEIARYEQRYWVLDHADDYSWSIVGDPSGRYLWILAREATPGEEELAKLIRRAEALGYDTSMLMRTKQP